MSVWRCPVCGAGLRHLTNRLVCEKGHSFDMARSGYVNLLPPNRKHARNPGDNALMIRARRAFLDAGHYSILRDALTQTAIRYGKAGGVLLDAGCGEGYYTENMMQMLEQVEKPMRVYGIDIAKCAVDAAAKRCATAQFAVGSVYHLPVSDHCCDLLSVVFAPYCGVEYRRVLQKGGVMLMVIPGQQHLWGLKEAIYDTPYPNAVRDYELEGFQLIQAEYVDSCLKLDNPTDIQNLFQMTPYYYKTGREEHARLERLETLTTEISFEILQYAVSN
ncbi:MAG: methyltransferase domain-containing protein [Ruminococcus sp.]|nr:methyltransferase domain-containing protein [Ruminococcus sp.]